MQGVEVKNEECYMNKILKKGKNGNKSNVKTFLLILQSSDREVYIVIWVEYEQIQ
jgi:ABC-type metal ion transport system substrate-binding protein